jgi:hypothetical protein
MQFMRRTTVWLAIAVVAVANVAIVDAGIPVRPGRAESRRTHAQAPAVPQVPAAPAKPGLPPQARVFTADVGMLVNYIKPEKTADFEMVISKLKDALAKSDSPERKVQAAGWRVLKLVEPLPNGNVVYVFLLDPVAKDTDYSPARILAEAFPAEVKELFKLYNDSFAGGVSLANYQLVASFK